MGKRTWAVAVAGVVMLCASAMQAVAEASAPASAPASRPGGEGKAWAPLGGLYEGNVVGFAEDAAGTIWAVAPGNGVFKSADGGATWAAFDEGLPNRVANSIAVNSKTGDLFVGSGGGGVFKLAKGGTAWQAVNKGFPKGWPNPAGIPIVSLSCTKAGDLFAGLFNGAIWRLPAGGDTWQATGKVKNQAWKDYVETADGRIWASGGTLIASTTDGGDNWTEAAMPQVPKMPISQIMCVAVDDAAGVVLAGGRLGKWGGSGGMFRSADNGKTWADSGLHDAQINSIAVTGGKVFAGCRLSTDFGALHVSEDHGLTWKAVTKGLDDLWTVYAVAVTSKGIFVGANGAYRSKDGGASFEKLNIPAVQYCGSIVVMDNGDIFTGGDMFGGFNAHGVSKRAHSGTTWAKHNKGLLSMDITTLIRNAKGELLAGDKYKTTYRLVGNGDEWTKSSFNLGLGAQELLLAANGKVIAGTATSGSFISSDDGSTFPVKSKMVGCQVNDLYLAPDGRILAGTEGGGAKGNWLMISTDNGETYTSDLGTPPSAANSTWSVGYSPTGTTLVATGGGVDEYLGDGKWRKSSKGMPAGAGARDFILNKAKTKVFAATTAGVFWSADPNEGWQRFSDGMPPTDVHCLAFDSHGYLYAGTLSGLFKTTTPQDK